ncbi:hypothetical protein AQUCO_03400405v1 [Aquilegia coerulea]|uniref:Uncharacterized protein n=1 Tax=Aquilegia coerulea TaxID=218851 RepID=A0A2G5CZ00_AQUCA|nr:hypothetical protein AQUCO_03400405v1 [Aquilegia coerulea]
MGGGHAKGQPKVFDLILWNKTSKIRLLEIIKISMVKSWISLIQSTKKFKYAKIHMFVSNDRRSIVLTNALCIMQWREYQRI